MVKQVWFDDIDRMVRHNYPDVGLDKLLGRIRHALWQKYNNGELAYLKLPTMAGLIARLHKLGIVDQKKRESLMWDFVVPMTETSAVKQAHNDICDVCFADSGLIVLRAMPKSEFDGQENRHVLCPVCCGILGEMEVATMDELKGWGGYKIKTLGDGHAEMGIEFKTGDIDKRLLYMRRVDAAMSKSRVKMELTPIKEPIGGVVLNKEPRGYDGY